MRTIVLIAALLCAGPVLAQPCILSGVTDQYTYFVAVDATDYVTRETGLSSFTVRRSRNGAASAAFTTPTINETDTSNMPGVYELLLDEDMTLDSGDDIQHMSLHITHAGMAPVTKEICIARAKITAGETATVDGEGDINANTTEVAGTNQTARDLGASVLLSSGTGTGQVSLASGTVTVGTNNDKTGYTASTVSDKTGYALSTAGVNAILAGQGIPDPTTIATLASQTSFTLTAGSADDNAYNGWGIVIRDASTATQRAIGCVKDYTGSSKTVTLLADPAIFTMATTDNVILLPAFCDAQTQQNLIDTAFLNCEVNTANFAGSTTTLACILTDKFGAAVTANIASNDFEGLEIRILSGAQKYEGRFINDSVWDGANSELRLTLSRALPATLADAVTAIIR